MQITTVNYIIGKCAGMPMKSVIKLARQQIENYYIKIIFNPLVSGNHF
jgi:hypothetical protein